MIYVLGEYSIQAIIQILEKKNLETLEIRARKFGYTYESDRNRLSNTIAQFVAKCYKTKITLYGDIVGPDILKAIEGNNKFKDSLNDSWKDSKLLWLASEHDKNSTLYQFPSDIIKEVAHKSCLVSFNV